LRGARATTARCRLKEARRRKPRPYGQKPNREAVWVGRAGPDPRGRSGPAQLAPTPDANAHSRVRDLRGVPNDPAHRRYARSVQEVQVKYQVKEPEPGNQLHWGFVASLGSPVGIDGAAGVHQKRVIIATMGMEVAQCGSTLILGASFPKRMAGRSPMPIWVVAGNRSGTKRSWSVSRA